MRDAVALMGRAAEQDALADLLRASRPVVLTGEAGIGKSALARDALGRVHPGFLAAEARASLAWEPFSIVRRLLGELRSDDPDAVVSEVLRRRPAAVLLDDVQWSDAASQEVALRLAGLVPLVATVRSTGEEPPAVVGRLAAAGCAVLQVDPLSGDDADLLACALHPDMPDEERAVLLAAAGGNPLLLRELGLGHAASPTLARALLGRLGAASPTARAAMVRLSVLGRPAGPATIGGGDEELVRLGIVRRVGDELDVAHPLLAEVLVAELDPADVDAARRALAPLVDAAEAAHLLAAAGDRGEARRLALRAAEGAAPRDRAELLDLAVRCGEPTDADVDLRLRASTAHVLAADPDAAARVVQVPAAAATTLEPRDRGRLGVAAMFAALDAQRHDAFARHLASTWPLLEGTDTPEEVRMRAMATAVDTRLRLDGRPVLEAARATAALADRISGERAYAHSRLGSVLLTAGEPGWDVELRTALDLARADGDVMVELVALESLTLGLWVTGDVAGAAEVARGPVGQHAPGSYPHLVARSYLALFDLLVGSDREALVARDAALLADHAVFRCRPFLEAAVAIARADLGDIAAADDQLRGADARAGDAPQWRSVVRWAEAELAWAAGLSDELERLLASLVDLDVGDYPPAVMVRVIAAHARVLAGRRLDGIDPAIGLLPAWSAFADEWRGLELAANHDDAGAAASFATAADRWDGSDARSRLRCLWAAADAARRAGEPSAVEMAELALRMAEDQSSPSMAGRIRRTLRAAGDVGAVASRGPRAVVSRREAEVLELVAAGRTSPQIADQLHLSRATVDSVVRSAMRKLGVRSRRAAAALWAEEAARR